MLAMPSGWTKSKMGALMQINTHPRQATDQTTNPLDIRRLHPCSGSFRLERSPGGTCTHWKTPPCHGAHPTGTNDCVRNCD